MKAVVDRIVQYANRYRLTNVETGEVLGTFDFDEVTGTVEQVGTEINAELFDSIAADLAARVVSAGGELAGTIVTFSDISGTAANVASGDTSATLWGKVKNWFSRLKALAFKDKISNTDVAENAAIAQSKVNGLESALAGKQPTITGAATSITNNNLTASRVVVSDESGKIDVSAVTATELNYISGADRNIQNQIEDIKDGTTPVEQAKNANNADRLNYSVLANAGTANIGWWKIGKIQKSKIAVSNNYSAIFLVNGVYGNQGQSYNEPSGIVEVDVRNNHGNLIQAYVCTLAGNLTLSNICVALDSAGDLILYHNLSSTYRIVSYTLLTDNTINVIELGVSFYGTAAPTSATYAVSANIASKVNNALTLNVNGTATVFDGSAAKTIDITSGGGGSDTAISIATTKWSSNAVTLTASDYAAIGNVTASSHVELFSSDASAAAFITNNIRLTAQAAGSITISCASTPTAAITANLLILN